MELCGPQKSGHGLLCFPVCAQLRAQCWEYKRHSVNICLIKQPVNSG